MDSDDPIRISLDHASERGVVRLRALLAGVGRRAPDGSGRPTTTDPAAPRIEAGTLVVPRACARETWAVLFRSDDPRLLAFAFRLFGEIQERGWVAGLWRSEWDDGEAPPTRTLRACAEPGNIGLGVAVVQAGQIQAPQGQAGCGDGIVCGIRHGADCPAPSRG